MPTGVAVEARAHRGGVGELQALRFLEGSLDLLESHDFGEVEQCPCRGVTGMPRQVVTSDGSQLSATL